MTHPTSAPARAVRRALVRAAALALAAGLGGCASMGTGRHATSAPTPRELQTLATLQPPLGLPTAAAPPGEPPSIDALQDYAQGRDALLRNQKVQAIEHLNAASQADPASAVVWRDLGYAELGIDDAKAAVAFRQASRYDPLDADARLQLARLLLSTDKPEAAVTELRLARLSPQFDQSDGLAAVIDLLLGGALEQGRYRTAALECYENVLAIVDDRAFDLRGRPELADVLARPGVLVLRTADLATQVGRYDRAVELYERLRKQEPQSAGILESRLARAQLAAGHAADATRRAIGVVAEDGGWPLSLSMFDELFAPHGGPAAALARVNDVAKPGDDPVALGLLRAHLLLAQNRSADAISALDSVPGVSVPLVRMTVHAYRAAGRDDELVRTLLARSKAAAAAGRWAVLERGWQILSQIGQPKPLTADALLAVDVPASLTATRAFVASRLYASQGRTASADRLAAEAAKADPVYAKIVINGQDVAPDTDATSTADLAVLIDDYRDDPELLGAAVAAALRSGQKRMAEEAAGAVAARHPGDAVVAVTYAQVLAGDDQRAEALAALDRATAAVKSASELYFLASQYSAMGEDKLAEKTLRRANELDPSSPMVCNDLGFLLADSGRDLSTAEQLLGTAVGREPDNPAYLDSLGWLLYKRSRFSDAVTYLEQAVAASSPVDPVVLDHAGDAFYQAKDAARSAERWQAAVDAIKQRGTNDPQLRLRIERKLRQLQDKAAVVTAPVAKAE